MIDFFIKRPIFSSVCAVIILIAGLISIPTLPIAQYPNITPPQVVVTANYAGASSEVVETTVTTVLERQINGVDGMRYMTSSSSDDGTSTITVVFNLDKDQDIAAVDVQNRISSVQSQLPDLVQRTGVTVRKQATTIMAMGLYSENGEYQNSFISNYADLYILDALKRIPGVGNVTIFGERRYAMRLWLDPNRLAARTLTVQDVVDAVNSQNLQVGAGQIGQQPSPPGQQYQLTVRAVGRLKEPTEFGDIVVKKDPTTGTLIKIKDVGRVELGAENYSSFLRFRGKDAVGLGISPVPGGNALNVSKGVIAEMDRLSKTFPPGLKYTDAYNSTLYVQESIQEVLVTLFEAILLVILVIFVFLQDWRTTVIPAITIPVSLIGTFIFIKAFNFSINGLTLFGLTLATGLVVDDAIVVIENIIRNSEESHNPDPYENTSEAMKQITGAVIATSLVLMAVFIPVAFFPGTTGQLYKQFALTIAFSIAISAFNALTLTPALSALLLKPKTDTAREPQRGWRSWITKPLNWFFGVFNKIFDKVRGTYTRTLEFLTHFKLVVMGAFVTCLVLTGWLFVHVPSAFIPEEDQGYFISLIQAPEGVSLNYTSDVMKRVEKQLLALPETLGTFAIGGFGFSGNAANSGVIFTTMKTWSQRPGAAHTAAALIAKMRKQLSSIQEAIIVPFNPPAIQGLSNFGGFQFELEDRGTNTIDSLAATMGALIKQGNTTPGLQGLLSTFHANTPQLTIEVDRDKAESLGVPLDQIFNTLQSFLGSRYVNDFNQFQRNYRVYVQADTQFRSNPSDINRIYVRSAQNQMIPLGNLVKTTSTTAPQTITHYNLNRSIEINGSAAPGTSSGQALQIMEKLAAKILPSSMTYEWSGTSLEEKTSGGQAPFIFALGIVFVFLVLAAQYESLYDPFVILLAVPLGILGALTALSLRGLPDDVYSQIGLVMLIGLASKNAILIVEFANQLLERGYTITKAAVEASAERLRPILMTSFAFMLGIFPLVIAEGAGAASRISLGTAVFGGMLLSTFLSLFVVPILYILIASLRDRLRRGKRKSDNTGSTPQPEPELEEVRR